MPSYTGIIQSVEAPQRSADGEKWKMAKVVAADAPDGRTKTFRVWPCLPDSDVYSTEYETAIAARDSGSTVTLQYEEDTYFNKGLKKEVTQNNIKSFGVGGGASGGPTPTQTPTSTLTPSDLLSLLKDPLVNQYLREVVRDEQAWGGGGGGEVAAVAPAPDYDRFAEVAAQDDLTEAAIQKRFTKLGNAGEWRAATDEQLVVLADALDIPWNLQMEEAGVF